MATAIDNLERLVTTATERLARLRAEIVRLERGARGPDSPPLPSSLADENRRLREERAVVCQRITALIQEIDRAL